ncbi:MAG TPA: hypothetical protein VMD04_01020 [Candidatus Margulisiibacteriota bacterium]|nr:hypothetical protein [Candidatus Margulisiibacteriota bacterium]
MESKNLALKVAGVVFLLVALMHLLRLLLKMQIAVAGMHVRLIISLIGFVAALLLSIWMFAASKK